jgi:hypothetical protein
MAEKIHHMTIKAKAFASIKVRMSWIDMFFKFRPHARKAKALASIKIHVFLQLRKDTSS